MVALLPSGWAQHGKWNREHAVMTKTVTARSSSGAAYTLHMTTHLLPYSEHSNFAELQQFLQVCVCVCAFVCVCVCVCACVVSEDSHHLASTADGVRADAISGPVPPHTRQCTLHTPVNAFTLAKFLRPARVTPIVFDGHDATGSAQSSQAMGKILARFTGVFA